MKPVQKSSFHKLYMIEEETYHKILPFLNEMDRQELLNLNEEYKDENRIDTQESNKDPLNLNLDEKFKTSTNQLTQNSINSFDKKISTLEPNISMPSTAKPKSSNSRTEQLKQSFLPKKPKKPKKYQCEFCNKGFTTKFSLKRHKNTFHSPTEHEDPRNTIHQEIKRPLYETDGIDNIQEELKITNQEDPKYIKRGTKRAIQEESEDPTTFEAKKDNQVTQTNSMINNSPAVQNEESEKEVNQKPVQISKYSNRLLKRKYQEVPKISDEENTYQKMPRIRGIKRTKKTQTKNNDVTDIKQMRYETGMTEADFLAPRGIKRQIKQTVEPRPYKKSRWINFS